jgi:hypothetical protein
MTAMVQGGGGDAGTVAGRRRGAGVDDLFRGPIRRPPGRTEPPPPDLVGVVVGEGAGAGVGTVAGAILWA